MRSVGFNAVVKSVWPVMATLLASSLGVLISAPEAFGQAPPIFGTAPVRLSPSSATPSINGTFTVEVSVDLTGITGVQAGATAPVGLTAFRIPITFDNTRVQLVAIAAGRSPAFAAATLEATPIPGANARGRLALTAVVPANPAPVGLVSVAILTFNASAPGTATIAASTGVSLSSAIAVTAATLYGPTGIPASLIGGGVVVQGPPALKVGLQAGPSPVPLRGTLLYYLHVENTGGAVAHSTIATVPIPLGTTFAAATGGGTSTGSAIQWALGDLAPGAVFDATASLNVTAAGGTTISGSPATAASTEVSGTSSSISVLVSNPAPSLKPGTIIAAASFAGDTLYDVTSGSATFFARIPSNGWIGPLLITPTGRLIATTDAFGGCLIDATAGGDLRAAIPVAQGLGGMSGAAMDPFGNIYVVGTDINARIRRISPPGGVSLLAPLLQCPSGLLVNSGFLYVAEGLSGSVRKIDLTSSAMTTFASGFPTGTDHFSGQLVRNSRGHIFVLWGHDATNLGLYDITAGGDFSNASPVTARGAFRVDLNQLAIDSNDNIYFAGDGTGTVWRSLYSSSGYGAVSAFAGPLPDNESMALFAVPTVPFLSLTTAASVPVATTLQPVTYTLNYANSGGVAASSASLSAVVPDGATFVSASNGGTLNGNQVTWSLGTLVAGATGSCSMTVTVTALAGGVLAPTVCSLSATSAAPVTSTLPQMNVVAPPNGQITVAPSTTTAPVGSNVTYTISYANTGGSAATAVTIQDTIPASTTFVQASNGGTYNSTNGLVLWNAGTLQAGQGGVVSFTVRIGGASGTTFSNVTCSISGANMATVVAAPAAIVTASASSPLTVTVVAGPNPVVSGTQINALLQYKNDSTQPATNVAIVLPLPPNATFLSATAGGTWDGSTVSYVLPSVAGGGSGTVRCSFRADASAGTQFALIPAISSTALPSWQGVPSMFEVRTPPTPIAPGLIISSGALSGLVAWATTTNPQRNRWITNLPITYWNYSSGYSPWAGAQYVGINGHVYEVTNQNSGSLYDLTAGGDYTNARPIVTNLGMAVNGLTGDDAGNLYCVSQDVNVKIRKITPEGDVTILPPVLQYPGSLIRVGNALIVSEGGTGTISRIDLNTYAVTPVATGFPPATWFYSGSLVYTAQGHLYVLWGNSSSGFAYGIYDITNGGTFSSLTPVTASDYYRIDVNQIAADGDGSIYLAGDGYAWIWRAVYSNGVYGPMQRYWVNDGDTEAIVVVPSYSLSIAASAPQSVNPGETLSIPFNYRNDAPVNVDHVSIDVPTPSGLSISNSSGGGGAQSGGIIHWDLGTVSGSSSGSVTITGTVTANEGSTLTVSGYTIRGGNRPIATGVPVSISVRRPLSIVAFASPTAVAVGQTITYTLSYENVNATAATNVIIQDTLPPGTSFVSASANGVLTGGTVTWALPSLAAGGTGQVSFVVTANATPAVTNSDYSIRCNELAVGRGPAVTTAVSLLPVILQLSGSATPNPVTTGEPLTYTFTYGNSGGSTAPSVVLRDAIPAGTAFSSATGGGVLNGQTVSWQLGSLTPASTGSVSLTVTVNASGGSAVTNSGTSIASGTQAATGNSIVTHVVSPPPPPPLTVALQASPQPVVTGSLLTYSITIVNPSDTDAENVVVTDAVPVGTSFVSSTGGGSASDTAVQWNLGTLDPGESIALALTFRVTAPAGATITNSGVSAASTGRNAGSSGVAQTSVIAAAASLRLGVVASPTAVNPGGSVTYSFTATNDGPGIVGQVQLTDAIPPNTIFVAAPGARVSNGTVTWSLGALSAGASAAATLVVSASAPAGSTIANGGSILGGNGAEPVSGPTVLTDVVAPPVVVSGALSTDQASYVSPAVVHETATFTYVSGGAGIMSGLTAALATANGSGTVLATSAQPISALASGASTSIGYDWSTAGVPSGTYTITFTVVDASNVTLFARSTTIKVSALDGANLTGTIAAPNSPVHQGTDLQVHITLSNQNGAAYTPLAADVDVLDPATLAVKKAVPVSVNVSANSGAAADLTIPTTGLGVQNYTLWLTTSIGGGRLLATGSASVLPPVLTLTPSSQTIIAGSTGTLTAALGAAPSVPVIVSLVSSNPAIVGVPTSVTIAAGSTSQTVPLQGVAVGGPVTITATLPQSFGGGSAASSAIVVMSGALTATLQVYQGESVSFGVTITNGGNTALNAAPFAIEIHDPVSGNLIDTVPLTASIAARATYTTTLPYVTANLAFQKYEARLVYTGLTPAALLAAAQFEVLKPPPLRLEASLGGAARVLIWSSCSPGNSGQPCTPVPPPFLVQTLTTAHIPFVVTGDEDDFLAKMRSGGFSCAVIDQANHAEPKIAPEYLDDVHAGFGLLFIHSAHDAMPKLDPALATKFLGNLHGPTAVTLLATPFTSAGTLTLNGNGTAIALDGAKAAATTASGDPAIAYNTYGRGNVVVVPFDLEQTPTSDVAKLILGAIGFVSRPLPATLDARSVVPIQIALTTPPGGAVPVTLSIALPAGLSIIDALPPLTTTGTPTWSATVEGNTTANFTVWVRVPDAIGTTTVSITASLSGGPPVITKSVDLVVKADEAAIAAALSNDLTALKTAATAQPDVKKVDDAIAQLSAIETTSDPLAAVTRIMTIIGDMQSLTIDATTARNDAERLLLYWQSRVGA